MLEFDGFFRYSFVMGRFIVIFSIIAAVHVAYMSQLGDDRLIVGILEGTIKYPPRKALIWYAGNVAKFEPKEGFVHPLHLVFDNCFKTAPFTADCQSMFDLVLTRGVDIDATSGVEYQLTLLYKAMLNCSPEAAEFLISRGAQAAHQPSEGPYSNSKPFDFLARVPNCRKKQVIKQVMSGEVVFGYKKDNDLVEWTRSNMFK